jgi:hypothetical protein
MSIVQQIQHRESSRVIQLKLNRRITPVVVSYITQLLPVLHKLSTPWVYVIVVSKDTVEDIWGYAYLPILLSKTFVVKTDFVASIPNDDNVEWTLPSFESKEMTLDEINHMLRCGYIRFKQYKGMLSTLPEESDWRLDQLVLTSVIRTTLFSTPKLHEMSDTARQQFIDQKIIPFEVNLFMSRLRTIWSSKIIDIAIVILEALTTPILITENIFKGLSRQLDRSFFISVPFEFAVKSIKTRNCVVIDGEAFLGFDEIYKNIGDWYGKALKQLLLVAPGNSSYSVFSTDERTQLYCRIVKKLLTTHSTIIQPVQSIEQTNILQLKQYGPLCTKKLITALENDIAKGIDAKKQNKEQYLNLENRKILVNVLHHSGVPSHVIEAILHKRIDRVYTKGHKGEKAQLSALVKNTGEIQCYGCSKIIERGWCGFYLPEIEDLPQRMCGRSIDKTEIIKSPKHYIEIKNIS